MEIPSHRDIPASFEHCLSEVDLVSARAMRTENGIPVVFLADGHPVDIVSGQLQPKETPHAERICYFDFCMDSANMIAKATKTVPVFVMPSN